MFRFCLFFIFCCSLFLRFCGCFRFSSLIALLHSVSLWLWCVFICCVGILLVCKVFAIVHSNVNHLATSVSVKRYQIVHLTTKICCWYRKREKKKSAKYNGNERELWEKTTIHALFNFQAKCHIFCIVTHFRSNLESLQSSICTQKTLSVACRQQGDN